MKNPLHPGSPRTTYELTSPESVRSQIDEVKDIMVDNIDKVLARGEHIDLLVNQTNSLQSSSVQFHKTAKRLKYTIKCRRYSRIACCVSTVILGFYFLLWSIYGNPQLQNKNTRL